MGVEIDVEGHRVEASLESSKWKVSLSRQPAWIVGDEKSFAGCRSWVDLPAVAAGLSFQPVLSESAHERKKKQFLDCTKEVAAVPRELQARGS
jgi:hypothetical protein